MAELNDEQLVQAGEFAASGLSNAGIAASLGMDAAEWAVHWAAKGDLFAVVQLSRAEAQQAQLDRLKSCDDPRIQLALVERYDGLLGDVDAAEGVGATPAKVQRVRSNVLKLAGEG